MDLLVTSITSERCPITYMQLAAEQSSGLLSSETIARFRDSVLPSMTLTLLGTAAVNRLSRECDEESQKRIASTVTNIFTKTIGTIVCAAGEGLMTLCSFLGGVPKKANSSSRIRQPFSQ